MEMVFRRGAEHSLGQSLHRTNWCLLMPRRVFISTAYEDANQARGFKLLQWNPNVDFEFVTRDLLSPVDSRDPDYIKSSIRERLNGTSVTSVLIGRTTAQSNWV